MNPLPNSLILLDTSPNNTFLENPSISFSTCYRACMAGYFQQVKTYLSFDPSLISQIDSEGQTLLYACAASNQLEIMQWLYEQNPLILNIVRPDEQTPMHIAIQKGYLEIVQWLHEKDSSLIDQPDNNQLTPLHQAAFHEAIPILKLFVKKLKNNAALIEQIARENCPKSFAFLLEQGVDPNSIFVLLVIFQHLLALENQFFFYYSPGQGIFLLFDLVFYIHIQLH